MVNNCIKVLRLGTIGNSETTRNIATSTNNDNVSSDNKFVLNAL